MTESINLLNLINCNFDTDNNIEKQNDYLKVQLEILERNHKNDDCDYLIKKELLNKIIAFLESILYQIMRAKDREMIKQIQKKLNDEKLELYNNLLNDPNPNRS